MAFHTAHWERGGVAIIMLLGFIGLAVPITIASIQTSGQLSRNSRVYDSRLTAMYNASAGVEVALHNILNDPNFGDGLDPSSPSTTMTVDNNGESINVTVTRIFTDSVVAGQGLVVSKAVMPTSTPVDTATTFTYTITIRNEGTGTSEIEEIKDFLPPGMIYATNSTNGVTTDDPDVSLGAVKKADWYLNDGAAPLPWDPSQGADTANGDHTPAQNVWEEVPEYWETPAYAADGLIRATSWEHTQWLQTPIAGNKWRWKVQLVRGGVSDLFTSSNQIVGSNNQWTEENISHDPGNISILAGDKLRIRLEVWSGSGIASDRKMEYRWGGYDGGPTNHDSRTKIPRASWCGDGDQYELEWDLSPRVLIQSQEELTLTFQADATFSEGTYYNQAQAEYRPSWDLNEKPETYSPNEADVTVGSGTPQCSHVGEVLVTKVADVREADPWVETTITYTVTFENTSPVTMWLCDFSDYLPPGFDYVWGSYTGDIDRDPHTIHWDDKRNRDRPHWKKAMYPENGGDHMFPISAGVTKSFTFQALATLEQGMTYFNETDAKFSDNSSCTGETKGQGGTTASSSTLAKAVYDIQAVAADGTVKARVIFSSLNGMVDVLSWQEY